MHCALQRPAEVVLNYASSHCFCIRWILGIKLDFKTNSVFVHKWRCQNVLRKDLDWLNLYFVTCFVILRGFFKVKDKLPVAHGFPRLWTHSLVMSYKITIQTFDHKYCLASSLFEYDIFLPNHKCKTVFCLADQTPSVWFTAPNIGQFWQRSCGIHFCWNYVRYVPLKLLEQSAFTCTFKGIFRHLVLV